jgi:tRNA-modifying protein YgfZ
MVITNHPTVIPLPSLGLLQVSGVDAAKFLQGQLTCDVRQISPQMATLGAYCDQKGRILASFRLFMRDNNYYLSLPKSILPATITELQKFAIFSKITLADVSDKFNQFGIVGAQPELLLKDKTLPLPAEENAAITHSGLTAIRVRGTIPRFLWLIETDNASIVNDKFQTETEIVPENVWVVAEITNGITSIYPETIGLFTPHQLNYPNLGAVSFNKGCYRGQEIVARMHFLGKLKQHLVRAQSEYNGVIKPGMVLVDSEQRPIGEIAMAVKIANSHYELLVTVMDRADNTQEIFINNAENTRINILTNANE